MSVVIAAVAAFVAGWAFHRWQTYWAIVRARGEMEQWIEHTCDTVLGVRSCEEMDEIMQQSLRWAWPATLTWWWLTHGYWADRRYKRRTLGEREASS